jgi:hypothetical protein
VNLEAKIPGIECANGEYRGGCETGWLQMVGRKGGWVRTSSYDVPRRLLILESRGASSVHLRKQSQPASIAHCLEIIQYLIKETVTV